MAKESLRDESTDAGRKIWQEVDRVIERTPDRIKERFKRAVSKEQAPTGEAPKKDEGGDV